jgi:hypothetical protein
MFRFTRILEVNYNFKLSPQTFDFHYDYEQLLIHNSSNNLSIIDKYINSPNLSLDKYLLYKKQIYFVQIIIHLYCTQLDLLEI